MKGDGRHMKQSSPYGNRQADLDVIHEDESQNGKRAGKHIRQSTEVIPIEN